jgi:class 3 adenylate cyclase
MALIDDVRHCGVLIVDIAGSTQLRAELGDAAAGRQLHFLLDSIIATARDRGASFIKAYGDDVLAVFERDIVATTAEVAILAQQLAARAGLRLYAGFHFGPVQFRQTDGHPDVTGQTINFVARLHKLAEDVPGQIFMLEDSVPLLNDLLRMHALPFGLRTLKGIGQFSVWTLGWQSDATDGATATATAFMPDLANNRSAMLLTLRQGATTLRIKASSRKLIVGRGENCELRIDDPERRVSATHLSFESIDGQWLLQDVSRNGTWMLDARGLSETLLPYCQKALVPEAGSLSLGRPFADDAAGRYRIDFTVSYGDPG